MRARLIAAATLAAAVATVATTIVPAQARDLDAVATIRSATYVGVTPNGHCVLSVRGQVRGADHAVVRLTWAGGRTLARVRAVGHRFGTVVRTPCEAGLIVPQVVGGAPGIAVGVDISRKRPSGVTALGATAKLGAALTGPSVYYDGPRPPAVCPDPMYAQGQTFTVQDLATHVLVARGVFGACTWTDDPVQCNTSGQCPPASASPAYAMVLDRPLPLQVATYLIRVGSRTFTIANPMAGS